MSPYLFVHWAKVPHHPVLAVWARGISRRVVPVGCARRQHIAKEVGVLWRENVGNVRTGRADHHEKGLLLLPALQPADRVVLQLVSVVV